MVRRVSGRSLFEGGLEGRLDRHEERHRLHELIPSAPSIYTVGFIIWPCRTFASSHCPCTFTGNSRSIRRRHNRHKDSIDLVNDLLERIRIPLRIQRLDQCVPALWVTLFEGLFQTRLKGIDRYSTHGGRGASDREQQALREASISNVRIVLRELGHGILQTELPHLSAEALVDFDVESILDIIEIFSELARVLDSSRADPASLQGGSGSWTLAPSEIPSDHPMDRISSSQSQSQLQSSPSSSSAVSAHTHPTKRRRPTGSMLREISDDVEQFAEAQRASSRSDSSGTNVDLTRATPHSKRRRIRFDMNVQAYTPPVLRLEPDDSPHTKALKLRRTRLYKEHQKTLGALGRSHPAGHEQSGSGAPRTPEFRPPLQIRDFRHKLASPWIVENKGSRHPPQAKVPAQSPSIPEHNFGVLERTARRELPGIAVPESVQTKAWNDQIRLWERALDSRLYEKKVGAIQHERLDSERQALLLEKQSQETARLQHLHRERQGQTDAKTQLQERHRMSIKIAHQLEQAQEESERFKRRTAAKAETLLSGVYDQYIKAQRQTILEERKFEKEQRKEQERRERVTREAQENYYRGQIQLLEEQLQELKREEEIVSKAQREEARRRTREAKERIRMENGKTREKLLADAEERFLRKLDQESIFGEKLGFRFRPTRT
ncbi:uncharacterized protein BJ171DRAFT_502060 [Polychytrium aggregatum]|uniref:uncharacterized protein n=1 Tax=Polychytrium aggregatum TaxID=110093 RepID=UPI0022FE9A82|nr:uncharacterized protein BJ171DRAFT_502060 [Polychytrium aggregatum]KAI9205420.1 hypothetical protein BJ171DRAFT_502060 [Polychytrium aggregatum]